MPHFPGGEGVQAIKKGETPYSDAPEGFITIHPKLFFKISERWQNWLLHPAVTRQYLFRFLVRIQGAPPEFKLSLSSSQAQDI